MYNQEYKKRYYMEHKDEILEKVNKYNKEHNKEKKEYSKKYYMNNSNDIFYKKKRQNKEIIIKMEHKLITLSFD